MILRKKKKKICQVCTISSLWVSVTSFFSICVLQEFLALGRQSNSDCLHDMKGLFLMLTKYLQRQGARLNL